MRRIILICIITCLAVSTHSCVREKGSGEECRSFVRFVYDHNMAFEDLFHNQANRLDLYLFDGDGVFRKKLSDECPAGTTFPRDYKMELPADTGYPVEIIAWSGLHRETITAKELVPGVSTKEDMEVALLSEGSTCSNSLRGLWHGAATIAEGPVYQNTLNKIELRKNTNYLRIVLQVIEGDEQIKAEDFYFGLSCINHCYDYTNETDKNNAAWSYEPCFTETDHNAGVVAEIHTLRFYDDAERPNNLSVTHLPTGEPVLDNINLNHYVNALKLSNYSSMPLQEYMDREDEYRIVILLKGSRDTGFVAADISINGWQIREQHE